MFKTIALALGFVFDFTCRLASRAGTVDDRLADRRAGRGVGKSIQPFGRGWLHVGPFCPHATALEKHGIPPEFDANVAAGICKLPGDLTLPLGGAVTCL